MIEIRSSNKEGAVRFEARDENAEFVGYLLARLDSRILTLDSLNVLPLERGKGIGGMLLEKAKLYAIQNGATTLILEGEFFPESWGGKDERLARAFYAKHGIDIDENNQLHGKIIPS